MAWKMSRVSSGLAGWVRKDHRNELAFYGGSFTALPLAEQEALLELVMPYRKAGYFTDLRLSTRLMHKSSQLKSA